MRALWMGAAALAAAVSSAAAPCPETPAYYEQRQYTIRQVRVDMPMPGLFAGRTPDAPALTGSRFSTAAWQQSQHELLARIEGRGVQVVLPQIDGCDDAARTLVVIYRVYTVPDPSPLLKAPLSLGKAVAAAPSVIHSTDLTQCVAAGAAYPIASNSGENYTASAQAQTTTCGMIAVGGSVRLHYPNVSSSYLFHAGKPARHEVQFASALQAGPVAVEGRLTSFYPDRSWAGHITAGVPVYRRPVVPASVAADPALEEALGLALSASGSVLEDSYLAESPAFQKIAANLLAVRSALHALPAVKQNLPAHQRLQRALTKLDTLTEQTMMPTHVRGLAVDFLSDDPDIPAVPALLTQVLADLIRAYRTMPELGPAIGRLERLLYDIDQDFRRLEASEEATKAQRRAASELADAKRQLRNLVHHGSLYAVGPVFLMNTTDRMPLAMGAGVRFTFLAVDMTVGYAWDVQPRPDRPRGAVTASFDLTNLFR